MACDNLQAFIKYPIRTLGCRLIFCCTGFAIVLVNFERRIIKRGDIVVLFPDTSFVLIQVSQKFWVYQIELSAEMTVDVTFQLSSLFFDKIYDNPILPTTSQHRELLEMWRKQIEWIEECGNPKAIHLFVRNQFQNLFIVMEREVLSTPVVSLIKPVSSTRQLFNRFCQLLSENFYAQHEVKFYADKLCITPYYLSRITFKMFQSSPKEMIDRQIIMEMKHILTTTDLSIKEIANQFHFETSSYMGRFFRRHTGMSPTEYRNQ
ncbi:MAG: AraC family transcriptional regulator [Parabacteroides sp.]|nr:AraC family transcriptional regulator [Parabacteroides sp.]